MRAGGSHRGRPEAIRPCLADLVELLLQHLVARVRIDVVPAGILALEGADLQQLLRPALLARVQRVRHGRRRVAEEASNALGNATERFSRLRDDVLGEHQRLGGLLLEGLQEDLAAGDISQLADGPDLTGELAQGAGARDFEGPEVRNQLVVVHVAVGDHRVAHRVTRALGQLGGQDVRNVLVHGRLVVGRSRRDRGEHHTRKQKDHRLEPRHVVNPPSCQEPSPH